MFIEFIEGLFGCGPISMEWSPRWAAFLADGPPYQILHLPEVLLLWPWLGWERLWVVVFWRGAIWVSRMNEWINKFMNAWIVHLLGFEIRYLSSFSRNGSFVSIGYPDPYPPSIAARYVFVGTEDERVQIIFTELELNMGTNFTVYPDLQVSTNIQEITYKKYLVTSSRLLFAIIF